MGTTLRQRALRNRKHAGAIVGAIGAAALLAFTVLAGANDAPASAALGSPASCAAYGGLPPDWGQRLDAGMVRVAGGAFVPGSLPGYPDETPAGSIDVQPFWIDRTEVTNAQFTAFVNATGYVTEAERDGGGAVFVPPVDDDATAGAPVWWKFVAGANWRAPGGPGSGIAGRDSHPVVMVTRADAEVYAQWLGRGLPTEAQWELAARAGQADVDLGQAPRAQDGSPAANFWQGMFPYVNDKEDGYAGAAPVGCFAANAFGLFDSIGNVWEWTGDEYRGPHQPHNNGDPARSGKPERHPAEQAVIKGGSFLCAENYCMRYRAAARHPQEANLPTAHVGFRTVLSRAPG